jgi:DNA-binding NtrC family response regulator
MQFLLQTQCISVILHCMRIGLLPSPAAGRIRRRLESQRLPVFTLDPARIQVLAPETAGALYLIAFGELAARNWHRLRVQLARASRQFIVHGEQLSTAEIVAALRDGAADVLDEADSDERWRSALVRAAEAQKLWLQLYGGEPLGAEDVLTGESAALRALRQTVEKIGPTDVNVLILGESGVGKEKVAQALHEASRRKQFVALNCAAFPKDLIEAEMFGVEKGAFTGALKSRPGLVEQAAGGTLFLDEIGEMDLSLQPKLLRFLETRVARRVGSEAEYRSRARIIAATNRDLRAEAEAGTFRADLFYRLAEITLNVPPLRERREDIAPLVRIFLRQAGERFGKNLESVEPALVQRFISYDWPGNARELKSAIDRLALLYDGPVLREGWWDAPPPAGVRVAAGRIPPPIPAVLPAEDFPNRGQKRELARRMLAESGNNLTLVAAQLGINPTTLWRWRKAGKL